MSKFWMRRQEDCFDHGSSDIQKEVRSINGRTCIYGKPKKKHKLLKTVSVISTLLVLLTACGTNSSKPDYLLEGARDNGFIAAYRGYYAIKDETVKKISKRKYERYIHTGKE